MSRPPKETGQNDPREPSAAAHRKGGRSGVARDAAVWFALVAGMAAVVLLMDRADVFLDLALGGWRPESLPLHSAIETVGAVVAIVMAFFLAQVTKVWVAD